LAADVHHHFVEMPATRRRRLARAPVRRIELTEIPRSASDRLIADHDPEFGQELLDIPQTERETKIQPHRMADLVGRKTVALARDGFQRALISAVSQV
jgi:hypothetical protein